MESEPNNPPLVVVVGETASGKTALAIELAKRFDGEIICADSRTVYKELNIGTAKPSIIEQQGIRHHLLDVVTPDEAFSAADFQRLANEAIADIWGRGKLPFLVGGTGLYIDSVLFNYSFADKADPELRERLQKKSIEELQAEITTQGITMPTNSRNARHLIRAIETGGTPLGEQGLRSNTLVIGLRIDREELRAKLQRRVDAMVEDGFVDEVRHVAGQYGWDAPGLLAPGYKAFRQYLEGGLSLEEAKQLFVRNDWQLAKRQRTWFKRNKSIHWVRNPKEAVELVTTFLNK